MVFDGLVRELHRFARLGHALRGSCPYFGWIERVDESHTGGRSRKAYVLSDLGRRILAAETERLRSVVTTAQVRLSEGQL